MFIKICGLSTAATVGAAVEHGADALGFVFAPGSPRTISPDRAAALIADVPAGVETVGVFRNQPIEDVLTTARAAGVSTVQLHGDEVDDDHHRVEQAGFHSLRAFSAQAYRELDVPRRQFWSNQRILLDAVRPGAGVTFDPAQVHEVPPTGFWLLAGGLDPTNVADLIAELTPSGVDVSSGVESSRGIKDPGRIAEFISAARPR